MTPERWRQVKALFEQALERAAAQRAQWLASACGPDEELRLAVERLLAQHERAEAEDFIGGPALPGATEGWEGRRLGAWRLTRRLGQGGMGTVYEAEREEPPRQHAAVKLLAGLSDSPHARQRFRSECRILARLEHPGIARFIDAGNAPDGTPYLVMERVSGEPVTTHAARAGLGLRARLELFLSVCAAVQYAHQRLVVHRDLKPGNILVGADGAPRLLDFGIARLLADEGGDAPTMTALRAFTPDYASPEQVSGAPIGTASDVYSLGVLLFELLTGERPLRLAGLGPAPDKGTPADAPGSGTPSTATASAPPITGDATGASQPCTRTGSVSASQRTATPKGSTRETVRRRDFTSATIRGPPARIP